LENVALLNPHFTGYRTEGFAKVKNFKELGTCTQPLLIDSTLSLENTVGFTSVVLELGDATAYKLSIYYVHLAYMT
jgi:hypothetical protein